MKRFMLFGGDTYYPVGGIKDFINSFNSFKEAQAHSKEFLKEGGTYENTWIQIYDIETKEFYYEYKK